MRPHAWCITLFAVLAIACDESEAHPRPNTRLAADASSTTTTTPTHTAWDTASVMGEVAPSTDEPGKVERYSAARLDSMAADLARGATTARTIGAHAGYHYVEARRRSNGEAEIHDRWDDITIVQAGHATLLTGGVVANDHLVSPGEHRGGTIRGGSSRAIAAGDLITIPAGTPHQYLLLADDSVRYLTIKVFAP